MRRVFVMIRSALPALLCGALMAVTAAVSLAADYVPGEVLVGYRPGGSVGTFTASVASLGTVVAEQPGVHVARMRLNSQVSVADAVRELKSRSDVMFAEPNYIRYAYATPNDAYFAQQYGPQIIKCPLAWANWQPQTQVIVAVLDTGVDDTHPDLADVMLRDSNGAIYGHNSLTNTNNARDDHGHGTHASGIAVARINNGIGIAGVAGWSPASATAANYIKLMPVKVLASNGSGTDASLVDGIVWAADHGARVLSMSLGSSGQSAALANAVQYAIGKGCVLVAAAGNSSTSAMSYPAACTGVISVAATDSNDTITSFSNYGSWVKVAAPGLYIYSTVPTYAVSSVSTLNYAQMSGTSMACPHVSGEAAMLLAQNPSLTPDAVSTIITTAVDPIVVGSHPLATGAGRINVALALAATTATPVVKSVVLTPNVVTAGTASVGKITLSSPVSDDTTVNLTSSATSVATCPASVTVPKGGISATFNVTTLSVTDQKTSTISAAIGSFNASAVLTVRPISMSSLVLSPTLVQGGVDTCTGTLTIASVAPTGGMAVSLSSTNSAATVPATVTVAAGQKTATFSVTTSSVTSEALGAITATFGTVTKSVNLQVEPSADKIQVSTLKLATTETTCGNVVNGTLTLSGKTKAACTVSLSSSDTSLATVPATVTVAAGATTTTFTVTTLVGNTTGTTTITATLNSSTPSVALKVNAPVLTAVALTPSAVLGGATVTGTVTISIPAGAKGMVVSLTSDNAALVVPATMTVRAGATTGTFAAASKPVASPATCGVTATLGSVSKTASATVNPAALSRMTLAPLTVESGGNVTGTVILNAMAPASGAVITLSSDAALSVPATVTVPAGKNSVTFAATAARVAANATPKVTATYNGASVDATITVKAPTVTSVRVAPTLVPGGTSLTGTVTLSSAVGSDTTVALASDNAALGVPATVTVTTGTNTATFTVTTTPVSAAVLAHATATLGSSRATATASIAAPKVTSVTLSQSTLAISGTVTATVSLGSPAPTGGAAVALTVDKAGVSVPATVTVAGGATSATFTVTVSSVSLNTYCSIVARYAGTAAVGRLALTVK